MTDRFTPEERSRVMSRVKGHDTEPERIVRKIVHRMGYRFRLHDKSLPGKPDIVLSRHKKVIFIHGCFWHGHKGCHKATRPVSNVEFWNRKLDGNMRRDAKVQRELKSLNWKSLTVWQCQTRDVAVLQKRLERFLTTEKEMAETNGSA